MSENPTQQIVPEQEEIPDVIIRSTSRFRLIWLIPIVAVLIGIWLSVKTIVQAGPTITITFKSAEGLQAAKTKIKYKDVEVGQVDAIRLSQDLSEVVVTANMVKEMEKYLTEHTRFWVVRARLAAGEVSGIGTILSGAYIGMDPGPPGKRTNNFKGLETPPVIAQDVPGTYYDLRAIRLGSLDIGSPVYFHQIKVGQVVSYDMTQDGTALDIKVFIRAPHDQRVLENTRFWNASGLDFQLDSHGIRINTDSLVSLLLGGVAFETPPNEVPGPRAAQGRQFFLFSSRDKTQEPIYSEKMYLMAYFDESVRGLTKGASVEFRGIKVGEVVDIKLEINQQALSFHVPVLMVIEPERLSVDGSPKWEPRSMVMELIENGLSAQLQTGMLLTGQRYVNLVMAAGTALSSRGPSASSESQRIQPAQSLRFVNGHPVIPTIPGPTEEILASVSHFLNRLEKLPMEEIGADLQESVQNIRELITSQDLRASLATLRQSLEEINRFAASLNNTTAPQLANLLDKTEAAVVQTRTTMLTAEQFMDTDSPLIYDLQRMILDLAKAGQAISTLADYLERHPEALIYGKGAPEK